MATTLDKAKSLVGHLLRNVHPSDDKLASAQAQSPVVPSIHISSSDFQPNMPIPATNTPSGSNISPALKWSDVPANTVELALIVEDPDAPFPNPVIHWIIYNIPPQTRELPQGIPQGPTLTNPPGARQSKNYANVMGYSGPRPPLGHGVHHYHFQIFALDKALTLNAPSKNDLLKAMQGQVIAQGEVVGTFERNVETD